MKNNNNTLRTIAVLLSVCFCQLSFAKNSKNTRLAANVTAGLNRLVNTRLDVSFDYQKHYLYGKEWITLTPNTAATDSLYLDAKGMDIRQIAIMRNGTTVSLRYDYDGNILKIKLDKKYKPLQQYVVYLNYVAKPDEAKIPSEGRIPEVRGLYFINTREEEKDKPVEIWTQGEPEGSSVWFPTIDKPDQKTLEEISITVPSKYVTLSNGRLISQKSAGNQLRTDTWKMDKPHAPYLFMMAVGDFKIYTDKSAITQVNYYLEKSFAPYAKDILGKTPEMLAFYTKILGVKYPWNKYSQVIVRGYSSGAMENTTATLIGDFAQKTPRELADDNYEDQEGTVAHELFHQWFGDDVTCKNWGNLTLNESLACWSETLWAEHKYGLDNGEATIYEDMQTYLNAKGADKKTLVRVNYQNPQLVFDEVTYQKGACILNMLRNYLGKETFYKGLRLYLTQNAYGTATVPQFRAAFEKTSNKDLGWFFNQWYYKPGHPALKIDYKWDEATKIETVYLQQTQPGDAFILPMAVDVYINKKSQRHNLWMRSKADTLIFKTEAKPELVDVDGDRILLSDNTDNKSVNEFIAQYYEAAKFGDRAESIDALKDKQDSAGVSKFFVDAMGDRNEKLRSAAIQSINITKPQVKSSALPVLRSIILDDQSPIVRAEAIKKLGGLKDTADYKLFAKALNNDSYKVEAAALNAIAAIDPGKALQLAKGFEKDNKGPLTMAIVMLYVYSGSEDNLSFVSKAFDESNLDTRFDIAKGCTILLAKVNNTPLVDENVEKVKDLAIKFKPFGVDKYAIRWLNTLKDKKQSQCTNVSGGLKEQLTAQVNFISDAVDAIKNAKKN